MPVCDAGGIPKADAPGTIVLNPQYMATLLPASLQWLAPFIPYVPAIEFDIPTLCANEPPDPNAFDADTLMALVAGRNPLAVLQATAAISELLHTLAWYQWCRCDALEQPDPPTYPSAPVGLPVVDPITMVPPTSPVCGTNIFEETITASQQKTSPRIARPAGSTSLRVTANINNPTYHALFTIHYFDSMSDTTIANGYHQMSRAQYNGAYNSFPNTALVSPGVAVFNQFYGSHLELLFVPNGSTAGWPDSTTEYRVTLEWFCGTTPGAPPTAINPCISCPPDQYLLGQLAQIRQLVSAQTELITLIQRQAVPFATVNGSTHSSLSGDGEVAVQGLLAARIGIVSANAGSLSITDGNPETLHGTGWIRWGDAIGWQQRVFLDSPVTYSAPAAAGAMTKIGYSLPPGMVIEIVEVEREP